MNKVSTTYLKVLVLALSSLLSQASYSSVPDNKDLAIASGRNHHPLIEIDHTLCSKHKYSDVSWLLQGHEHFSYGFDGIDRNNDKDSLDENSNEGSEIIGNEITPSSATDSKNFYCAINTGTFCGKNNVAKELLANDFAIARLLISTNGPFGFTGTNISMYVTKTLLL